MQRISIWRDVLAISSTPEIRWNISTVAVTSQLRQRDSCSIFRNGFESSHCWVKFTGPSRDIRFKASRFGTPFSASLFVNLALTCPLRPLGERTFTKINKSVRAPRFDHCCRRLNFLFRFCVQRERKKFIFTITRQVRERIRVYRGTKRTRVTPRLVYSLLFQRDFSANLKLLVTTYDAS